MLFWVWFNDLFDSFFGATSDVGVTVAVGVVCLTHFCFDVAVAVSVGCGAGAGAVAMVGVAVAVTVISTSVDAVLPHWSWFYCCSCC